MNHRTIFILLYLILQNNNLEAFDSFQQKIYDAEYCILIDRYDQAILRYNEAQRIRPINLGALCNYLNILLSDSSLKKQYFDTLISFVIQHEDNKYFKKYAYRYIDSNEIKKKLDEISASKFYNDIYNRKAKIREQLQLIQDEDQKIRREVISAVGRDSMYIKEPYRTKIHLIDSSQYIQFCQILKEINCDKYITDVILDFPALLNHFLIFPDSNMTDKLSLLISDCIDKEVYGREKLAASLQYNYNTSRYHQPNPNYDVMIDIAMTFKYLFYKLPSKEELNELNIKRNKLGLESIERYLSKLIWTMKKHDCDSRIDLVHDRKIFAFKDAVEEKEFTEFCLSNGYKSISVKCTSY